MTMNYDAIKTALEGRHLDVTRDVAGVPAELLDGRHYPCPRCGGNDRFSLVDRDKGAVLCRHCFHEHNGDSIAAVRWMRDASFPEAMRLIGDYLNVNHNGNGNANRNGKPPVDVLERVAREKHVSPEALRMYGAIVEGGAVVVPMFGPDGSQCSTFTMKPGGTKGLNAKGKPSGLFLPHVDGRPRLPQAGEHWLIVEGCKDSAALSQLGYLAVGLPMATMSVKFASMFTSVDITIVPDRDEAGENGADKTASRLRGHATSVKIAVLPTELKASKGPDVRDVLRMASGKQLLRDAIANAKPWQPPALESTAAGIPNITQPDGRTEAANARRLVARFGDSIRWSDPWQQWLCWDGRRWAIDAERRIESLAKEVVAELWRDLATASATADEKSTRAMIAFCKASNAASGVRNMLALARSEQGVPILPDKLDTDPWLLNVTNGVVDLRAGKLRQHNRADLITKLAPVMYDSDADCPTWLAFLRRILPDDPLRSYVRRVAGYCLTGAIREHVLPICWGTGANGKSTLLDVLLALAGDYGHKAPSDLLLAKRDDTHPTAMADLHGKRLVACVETGDGRRLAETLCKEMTGGDQITARRMRENYWTFTATHKLILATNHKPVVRGTDYAVWRRLKLIPFSVTIPESQQDGALKDKLLAELPGILNWAILGCVDWQANGLGEPDEIRTATANYRDSMDVLAAFLSDCCIIDPSGTAKASDVRASYDNWCKANGERPISGRRFGEYLTDRDITRRTSNGTWYSGLRLQ